jgi:antibiotic biosynthesis monooxygenase (ABM) superfamily enzyme
MKPGTAVMFTNFDGFVSATAWAHHRGARSALLKRDHQIADSKRILDQASRTRIKSAQHVV